MHFIDKYSNLAKQCFDTAIITDIKCNAVGKIIIRYTNAQIGYNNETGIIFHPANLNFSKVMKNDCYGRELAVFELLTEANCKVLDLYKKEFTRNKVKGISTLTAYCYIRHNKKLYKIHWV